MATLEQQIAFIRMFDPIADSAATQLNINSDFPLAQWALESGWGVESNGVAIHNVAGICSDAAGTIVAAFPDWTTMVARYVNSMRADCPAIQGGHVTPQSDAHAILAGTNYNSVNTAYADEVAKVMQEIVALKVPEAVQQPTYLSLIVHVNNKLFPAYAVPMQDTDVTHVLYTALDFLGTPYTHEMNVFNIEGHGTVTGTVIEGTTFLPWDCLGGVRNMYAEFVPGGVNFTLEVPAQVPTQETVPVPTGKKVSHIVVYFTDGTTETINN